MSINLNQILMQTKDVAWETFPDKEASLGDVRWKIFAGAANSKTKGVTFGVCEVPPGCGMNLHHHQQPEYYYIQEGEGIVYLEEEIIPIEAGSMVYIPSNATHGIRNTANTIISLIWIFPTDRWNDVKYEVL